MMAIPNSDTNPTAADTLKFVPVRYSAQMPPTPTSKTFVKTTIASRNDLKAEYSRMKIKPSEIGMMNNIRVSASCICSNSPLQTVK